MSDDIYTYSTGGLKNFVEDVVNHPPHYTQGKYECIDVIEDWFPDDPHLFTATQYLARAPHKGAFKTDLEKAIWYINRRLQLLESK